MAWSPATLLQKDEALWRPHLLKRARVLKGESAGHEFRGNQWTGGISGLHTSSGEEESRPKTAFGQRLGRCYELAAKQVVFGEGEHKPGDKLVHGSIQGFGNPRIGHAWVERADGSIHEVIGQKDYPRFVFGALFNPIEDHVYTSAQATQWMLKSGHFGSWEPGSETDNQVHKGEAAGHPFRGNQWVEGESGGKESAPRVPKLPPITDPKARAPAVDAIVQPLVGIKDTETLYDKINGQIGRYTAERQAMQDRYVQARFQAAIAGGAQRNREAIIMGGPYAAGKTTSLGRILSPEDQAKFITLSPDLFKEDLARGGESDPPPGLYPMEATSLIHEESSKMTWDLAELATAQGYNVIWDISMQSPDSVGKRIAEMNQMPPPDSYHTTGVFIDVPISQSLAGAEGRYANGLKNDLTTARFTTPERITSQIDPSGRYNTLNRSVFEQTKSSFDQWVLIDNTNYAGRVADQSHDSVIVSGKLQIPGVTA
jgi:hypothetical protein